ncbi:hypothetical protein BGY98DRAFT_1098353 [Russula aff. rugulosa BPL654]|nr:hypothetical protein BGY98DRAFT_1098353 [Russula aff. rugulosa BPL654]
MSAPPRPSNPDRRPLPDGWITRYDEGYRAWYYVDTRAQPPRSAWDHPLDASPPSPPSGGNYPPPPNPAPNRGVSQPYNQQPGQSYPVQPFNQAPPYSSGGYQGGNQAARVYQQGFQPQQGYPGAPPGNYEPGWQQGWQQPQQAYPAQPPVQTVQQPARSGRNNALLGAGDDSWRCGLVGGVVLSEMFEHHEQREEDQAYDQGYDQGFDNGADTGFGGGDW